MDVTSEQEPAGATVTRAGDRELVVTRVVNGPARLVFDAWTTAELFRRWWIPTSFPITIESCEMDVRVGGGYRLELAYEGETSAFFGRYLEVEPPTRLVWTNDEDGGETVTTVTFEEIDGRTRVTVNDRYPSKEALDEGVESGAIGAMPEQLAQLDEVLATLA